MTAKTRDWVGIPSNLWLQGILFFIFLNLLSLSWMYYDFAQPFYEGLNKPNFAPPGWIFGPFWIVNNIFVIISNLWAINLRKASTARTTFLLLQGANWFIYGIFSALVFGTKMPIFFFVLSVGLVLVTLSSLYFGWKLRKRIFWALLPQALWMTFATFISYQVWMMN